MPYAFRILCLCLLTCGLLLSGCWKQLHQPGGKVFPFDATGLTVRPGETPEEIILRAEAYDDTATVLAVAGFSYGIGGFPKNTRLAFAYVSMGLGGPAPVLTEYSAALYWAALWEKSPPYAPDDASYPGCKLATQHSVAENLRRAGIFNPEEWCPGQPVITPENRRWTTGMWDIVQTTKQVTAVWAAVLTQARETPPESLTDNELGGLKLTGKFQAFLAASSHDPEYERPVVSREKLLALARIHAHETNCAIRDGAVRYLNDTAPEAREAALIRIRAALGGDPEAMRAMADRYESEDASIPRTREAARVWREEADKAAAKANAAP